MARIGPPSNLQVLGEREIAEETSTDLPRKAVPPPTKATPESRLLPVIALGLRVLSERSILLGSHLFPLFALATGFYLFMAVLPAPSQLQLAGCTLYAAFMLLMMIVRK